MNIKKIIISVIVVFFLIVSSRYINNYAVDFMSEQKEMKNGLMAGAHPYSIDVNPDITILLIHGTSSSPRDFIELSQFLASKSISSRAILLPGHGTHPKDLANIKYTEWTDSIEREIDKINSKNKFVLGYSIGGTLALDLAEKKDLNGIIIINSPIELENEFVPFIPFISIFQKYHVKQPEDIILIEKEKRSAYDAIPLNTIIEMTELIDQLELENVEEPILIIQTRNDTIVSPKSADLIFNLISSNKKEIMWLESSTHGNLYESEKRKAFERTYEFIKENSIP